MLYDASFLYLSCTSSWLLGLLDCCLQTAPIYPGYWAYMNGTELFPRSSSGVAKNNKLQKGAFGQAFYNDVHAEMHSAHAEGTKPTTRPTVQRTLLQQIMGRTSSNRLRIISPTFWLFQRDRGMRKSGRNKQWKIAKSGSIIVTILGCSLAEDR